MYLPGVSVGTAIGVAVCPPGQSGPPSAAGVDRRCCRNAASRSASPSRRRCRRCCRRCLRRWRSRARPPATCRSPMISGANRLCICAGLVVQLQFPDQRHVLDRRRTDQGLVALPRRALRVAAIGQPIRAASGLRVRAAVPARHARQIAPTTTRTSRCMTSPRTAHFARAVLPTYAHVRSSRASENSGAPRAECAVRSTWPPSAVPKTVGLVNAPVA